MASNEPRPSLLLPNNPSFTTSDPLGLSDSDKDEKPVLPIIFSHLLDKIRKIPPTTSPEELVSTFISHLSDISYTLHNAPDPNLNILKSALIALPNPHAVIRDIMNAGSTLLMHFPSGSLPSLEPGESRVYRLTQLKALISHQFIMSLPCPTWNDWGGVNLSSWFSDADGIIEPKRTYVDIILQYLKLSNPRLSMPMSQQRPQLQGAIDTPTPKLSPIPIPGLVSLQSQTVTFHLCHTTSLPDLTVKTPLIPLKIIESAEERDFPIIPTDDTENMEIHTIYIISSHRLVGHGPAATQEERLLASVPLLLPISTFTPPLEDNTALAVTSGAEGGFTPVAVFNGHGRTARLDKSYNREEYQNSNINNTSSGGGDDGRIRVNTFLSLNATELDGIDLPEGTNTDGGTLLADFLPGLLEKDLWKAYTGFFGVFNSQKSTPVRRSASTSASTSTPQPHKRVKYRIVTPPWGCGAFGGDIRVKLMLLWIAASFAAANSNADVAVELVFLVKLMAVDAVEVSWREMIGKIEKGGVGADEIWQALKNLRAQNPNKNAVLENIVKNLGFSVPKFV
ncbi:hypothetical protein TWF694_010995 [Orbilia ellipsospora]|uniref:PARG catalytic Macro domain-containing protein n=1 Tax=Orbilia ellipsospora TaxID=2528407 RepID=A0AAV9XDY4_9PEZI